MGSADSSTLRRDRQSRQRVTHSSGSSRVPQIAWSLGPCRTPLGDLRPTGWLGPSAPVLLLPTGYSLLPAFPSSPQPAPTRRKPLKIRSKNSVPTLQSISPFRRIIDSLVLNQANLRGGDSPPHSRLYARFLRRISAFHAERPRETPLTSLRRHICGQVVWNQTFVAPYLRQGNYPMIASGGLPAMFRNRQEREAQDRTAGNGQIAATLVRVLSDMAGESNGFPVFGDDPTYGTAMGCGSLKLVEAHPALSPARVHPFDQSQRTVSHASKLPVSVPLTSGERVRPMPRYCALPSCGRSLNTCQQDPLLASMCVHMPCLTSYPLCNRSQK